MSAQRKLRRNNETNRREELLRVSAGAVPAGRDSSGTSVTREWSGSLGDLGWASLAEAFTPGSALVAVVCGPLHEVVYTNDAYAEVFGPASADGAPPILADASRTVTLSLHTAGRRSWASPLA